MTLVPQRVSDKKMPSGRKRIFSNISIINTKIIDQQKYNFSDDKRLILLYFTNNM